MSFTTDDVIKPGVLNKGDLCQDEFGNSGIFIAGRLGAFVYTGIPTIAQAFPKTGKSNGRKTIPTKEQVEKLYLFVCLQK